LIASARKAEHGVSGDIAATAIWWPDRDLHLFVTLHFWAGMTRCMLVMAKHADNEAAISAPGFPPNPGPHAVGLHLPQRTDRIF
jgi:hypothetical protein